jgi:hypothetical protein
VSVPHLVLTRDRIVSSQGIISMPYVQFDGLHLTAFAITRTSDNPLTSQMMVNDVTTEMNRSTIYCSNDDDENGAPMAMINVLNEGNIRFYS